MIAVDVAGVAAAARWQYELTVLFQRVNGPRWAVSDPDGEVSVDDLSVEEVVPLVPGRPTRMRGGRFESGIR